MFMFPRKKYQYVYDRGWLEIKVEYFDTEYLAIYQL